MNKAGTEETRVREAALEDCGAICRLLAVLFEQESEFNPDFEAQSAGVRELLANPQMGRFLVIEVSGQIVGAVSLLFLISTALGGKVALLEDLILAENWRGGGLGTLLLNAAIQVAVRHECMRITVLTDKDNTVARSLYNKLGFKDSSMIPLRLVF